MDKPDPEPGPIPRWRVALAHIHEDLYGPLPDSDIIATQGRHLLPCPDTPLDLIADTKSTLTLEDALKIAINEQSWRIHDYGEAAEEWPQRHTPPHLRQRKLDKQNAAKAELDALTTSDDESIRSPDSTRKIASSYQTYTPPSSSDGDVSRHVPASHEPYSNRTKYSKLAATEHRSTCQTPTKGRNFKTTQGTLDLGPAGGTLTGNSPASQKKRRRGDLDKEAMEVAVKKVCREVFPRRSDRLRKLVNPAETADGNHAVGEVHDEARPRRSARLKSMANSIYHISNRSPQIHLHKRKGQSRTVRQALQLGTS